MSKLKIDDSTIAHSKFTTPNRSYYATDFDGGDEYFGLVFFGSSVVARNFSREVVNKVGNEDLQFKPTAVGEVIKLHKR